MRVLIADDEAALRAWLRRLLEESGEPVEVVAETADGPATLAAIAAHAPEVAFLDIRMPGCSGLDVAARLAGACHIVFVTAHDEFAVAAFEQAAVDYLVKPVRAERLAQTLKRLRALSEKVAAAGTAPSRPLPAEQLQRLLAALQQPAAAEPALRWLTASSGERVRLIDINHVDFFAAQDKYTEVHADGEAALLRQSLSRLEERLDGAQFWRIHRGYIVRVAAIAEVRRDLMGRLFVRLAKHPELLPVSRACAHLFKAM